MPKVDAERSGSDPKLASTDLKRDSEGPYDFATSSIQDEVVIRINEDQKLGVIGAVLISNKMIGMGSTLFPNFLRFQLNFSTQSSQHPLDHRYDSIMIPFARILNQSRWYPHVRRSQRIP